MIIESFIIDYLNNNLPVSAYAEEPEKPGKRYVLVEKTGSRRRDFVTTDTVAIQSYAESKYEAAVLNTQVIEAMWSMVAENAVSSVKLNSDYDYTDTRTKRYRYQAVFDITHM